MKRLYTVIFISISLASFANSAFADDQPATCTQDLYNLGKCAVVGARIEIDKGAHAIGKDAVALKDDLAPPMHEAKLKVEAGTGVVVLDFGGGVVKRFRDAGEAIGLPWKGAFQNMEGDDNEKNQDVAHAVGDFGKATGKSAEVVGKGIWHGLQKLGHTAKAVIIEPEMQGFKDYPNKDQDVVGFLRAQGHGAENILFKTKGGIYKLFHKVKDTYVERRDNLEMEDNNKELAKIADNLTAKARNAADQPGASRSPAVLKNDSDDGATHSGQVIPQ